MGLATTEITNMQNQTAYMKNSTEKNKTAAEATSDSNMFLTLMLQQLQNQDPTQPTDNTEWLAQLAQYSSLEQMAQMNTNLSNCMGYMAALNSNIAANAMGLGSAATPFGLKAMKSMQKENTNKKVLSNSMAMFIVLNTASIQIIPTTVIAIRSSLGSNNPTAMIVPIWIATICAATAAVCSAKILMKKF